MQEEPSEFAAFVGIDWADQKHDVCLSLPGSDAREHSIIEHRPAAIEKWAQGLRERFNGAPVAVCIELAQGPIVSALLEHDFFVLFPVNPTTLARYRRAFTTSRAKDDPSDAEVAVDILTRHRDKLTRLRQEAPAMRMLRRLVEGRCDLVQDRVRLTNRITHLLKEYFPQVLQWFRDKETSVFADFVERWPTLPAAQRARRETLVAFFHAHNVRKQPIIEKRIEAIRTERPLTSDKAVIDPSRLMVIALLPQLRALCGAIARLDTEIAHICELLPDHKLFASLPGAGPVFSARLLAAFGERRERFPTTAALQMLTGIAPVTERSGNKHWVHWRWACPKFLRQSSVEWTAETVTRSFWARAFYDSHRAKGASHNATIRALAFKWIRILFRCWVDRTPYDESRYLLALQKRSSPILKFAAQSSA
jgi:transposase